MQEQYMNYAIKEAKKALKQGEIPIGAVIVYNNKIISRGYNKKETNKNSLMHAEIIAINKACKKIGDWRLNDCELYVTLEPCLMCLGAILESRIKTIYCGITNNKTHDQNIIIAKENNIKIEYDILSYKIKKDFDLFFQKIRNNA